MFRKIAQPFYTAYALTSFIICFMAAFPFNLLFSIGKNVATRKRVNKMTRLCFKFWLLITGLRVKVTGAKPNGNCVFVANHSSYIDDIIIFSAIPGHFRPLGKKEMVKIPFWGYQYKHIVILIDRKNPKSRALSMRLMWRVLKREGSVLIFPEGTFNETVNPLKDFYDGAFRLAISAQTPVVPVIFPDAVNRAHYSAWWKIWPGQNRCILLDPIPVSGMTLEDASSLKQQVHDEMASAIIKCRTDSSLAFN